MENVGEYIEMNPAIMLGKPVIKGTRITVESIVAELAAGYTMQQILQAHPHLRQEHIYAALQYAVSIMKNEKVYPVTS